MQRRLSRLVAFVAFFLIARPTYAQRAHIVGTVVCRTPSTTQPGRGVLVVYAEDPAVRGHTSAGAGRFVLVVDSYGTIRGKDVVLEFWPNANKETRSWPVSHHPRYWHDGHPAYVVPENIKLDALCNEVDRAAATSAEREENGLQSLATGSHFLQLLSLLSFAANDPAQRTVLSVEHERIRNITFTQGNESGSMFLSRSFDFPQYGFRYAPLAYTAAALATNPAGSAFNEGLEIQTNGVLRGESPYRFSAGATYGRGSSWALGLSYHAQFRNQLREIEFGASDSTTTRTASGSHSVLLSFAYLLSPALSVAIQPTLSVQVFNEPVAIDQTTTTYGYVDDSGMPVPTDVVTRAVPVVKREVFPRPDLTISVVYDPFPLVRIGASVHEIFGSQELIAGEYRSERVFGLGYSSPIGRWRLGVDGQYSMVRGLNGSYGINFLAKEWLEFGAGFTTERATYRAWTRLASLMISASRTKDATWHVHLGSRLEFF